MRTGLGAGVEALAGCFLRRLRSRSGRWSSQTATMPIEAPTAASVKRSSPFSTGDRSGEKWETSITTTSEMVAILSVVGNGQQHADDLLQKDCGQQPPDVETENQQVNTADDHADKRAQQPQSSFPERFAHAALLHDHHTGGAGEDRPSERRDRIDAPAYAHAELVGEQNTQTFKQGKERMHPEQRMTEAVHRSEIYRIAIQ